METRNKITVDDLQALVDIPFYIQPIGTTLTICVLPLKNGGVMVGKSACVDPTNFDEQIGKDAAYKDAINKLWELEGYNLLVTLHQREDTFLAIAAAAHEANAAYSRSIGDNSQPTWAEAPQWQKDSAVAGVRMHFDNPDASPRDSHQSWLTHKEADGWVWGEVKSPEDKTHPCMVPYDDLPPEQQAKDDIYTGVVKTLLALLR